MAVHQSSISAAIKGVADYLAHNFLASDVHVLVDTPTSAAEKAKASGTLHYLNLFVYRVAPSGFHAATTSEAPLFVRVNALLTPFLHKDADADDDSELRIIGHAIRVLQSSPEVPGVLPPSGVLFNRTGDLALPDAQLTKYRLQAILLAPTMEELNHIWTTQNSELAYRLSAAYEFSLIPIEPFIFEAPPKPVHTAIYDVAPTMKNAAAVPSPFDENTVEIPLAGATGGNSPVDWLPVILFEDAGALTSALTLPKDTNSADLAVSGLPGEKVAVDVVWIDASGVPVETQAVQIFAVSTPRIDLPQAKVTLALKSPWPSDAAIIRARPASGGAAVPNSPFANTLSLKAP